MPPDIVRNMGQYFGMRWKSMCADERQLYSTLEQVYKEATSMCLVSQTY